MASPQSKLRRSIDRAGPLGVALALGVVLVASSGLSYRDSQHAAAVVAERQGIDLLRRLDGAFEPRSRPERAALQAALEANRAIGLRYVGLVDHDVVVAEVGEPRLAGARAAIGTPVSGRERVRMAGPTGPPRDRPPPEGWRREGPPPEDFGPPGPPPFDGPLDRQDRGQDRREDPGHGPPHGPRHGQLVIEFEPLGSEEAVRRALAVLWLSSGAAALLTAAALILWSKARRAEEAEAQLSAQRHLARLGEMSAVLAHQIRNPLAALKGHAQLLAERATDAETAGRVARVVEGAVRLEQLTNDLLVFARDGALHIAPADPVGILNRAAQATATGQIDQTIDGAPARFELDAARVEQVLINLLDNALAVTPPGARVTARVVTVGDDLVFSVQDRGPGISPGERERIFEPFHTTKTRGTGLGLALVKRIVDLHGGTIEVHDAPGGGAIFSIRLPAQRRT